MTGRPMRSRPTSVNDLFAYCFSDGIVHIHDKIRTEWRPVLAEGQWPDMNIQLMLRRWLDRHHVNPQKLDRRLYAIYEHAAARLNESVLYMPPALESINDKSQAFIYHYTDMILHTNEVIEDQWKPARKKGERMNYDIGKVMRDYLEARSISHYSLPHVLWELFSSSMSVMYDYRDKKAFGYPIN